MPGATDHAFPEPEELRAHHAFLRRLARGLVGDEGRSEDVVQDAWAAWLERPREDLRSTRAWLARVVQRLALNAHRGELRRARREREAARPERVAPEDL